MNEERGVSDAERARIDLNGAGVGDPPGAGAGGAFTLITPVAGPVMRVTAVATPPAPAVLIRLPLMMRPLPPTAGAAVTSRIAFLPAAGRPSPSHRRKR